MTSPATSLHAADSPKPAGVEAFRQFSDTFARAAEIARKASCRVGGGGSGTVITEDGLVVTNNHVVGQAKTIDVTVYATGKTYKGKVVCNAPRDIALVKLDGQFPFHARIGDCDKLEIGDWVIACGMPWYLTETITEGIITNKTRGGGERRWSKFFHTNAAENPGNSGGGLFNLNGDLIGVNGTVQNYFVCIGTPIEYVCRLMSHFRGEYNYKSAGQLQRGQIGAEFVSLTDKPPQGRDANLKDGVVITGVTAGGAAAQAGLRVGDIVTHFNGFVVDDQYVFESMVRYTKPGAVVQLRVLRGGAAATINARVAEKTEP